MNSRVRVCDCCSSNLLHTDPLTSLTFSTAMLALVFRFHIESGQRPGKRLAQTRVITSILDYSATYVLANAKQRQSVAVASLPGRELPTILVNRDARTPFRVLLHLPMRVLMLALFPGHAYVAFYRLQYDFCLYLGQRCLQARVILNHAYSYHEDWMGRHRVTSI